MRKRSLPRILIASVGLPLALWAAVPAVQWCAAGTDLADAACFFNSGATAEAAIVLQHDARAHQAAIEASHHVAQAHRVCTRASCPYTSCTNAAAGRAAAREALPIASSRARAPRSVPAPRRARNFCLTDPNGGVGVRPHPPVRGPPDE